MTIDLGTILNTVLAFLGAVPAAGPVLVGIGKVVAGLLLGATVATGVLHLFVQACKMVATVPGFSGLGPWASNFAQKETEVEGWYQSHILPILDRLSLLAPPQAKPMSPPVVASSSAPTNEPKV